MRLVAWNCNMALHRKLGALLALRPDVAVVSECASPDRLVRQLEAGALGSKPVWVGANPDKGLAVFGFNGFRVALAKGHDRGLDFIAPVNVNGPARFRLLAVWAQNASGGNTRKDQAGPLHHALTRYADLLKSRKRIVAGDFNNNVLWDRPGWAINHADAVGILANNRLVSAYHELRGEAQGAETVPTLYWRDRKKGGPTYHIDYVFLPRAWLRRVRAFEIGTFEDWCGNGLSDHVPLILDLDL